MRRSKCLLAKVRHLHTWVWRRHLSLTFRRLLHLSKTLTRGLTLSKSSLSCLKARSRIQENAQSAVRILSDSYSGSLKEFPRYSGPALCGLNPWTWIPIPRSAAQCFSDGSTQREKAVPTHTCICNNHSQIAGQHILARDWPCNRHGCVVRWFGCIYVSHACNFTQLQSLGTWLRG